MEAVVFIGLQASGKSTFYKERFFRTHVRISLDLLRTRNRERHFLEACFSTNQAFVVDNTNPSHAGRSAYIAAAKSNGYTVLGFYFQSRLEDCLHRNQLRSDPVPEIGLLSVAKKLELPKLCEGYTRLSYVRMGDRGFVVEDWKDEL